MKLIRKSQTKLFKGNTVAKVIEYHLEDKDLNASIAKISGRYPSKNFVVNQKCKEIGHVLNGKIILGLKDREVRLKKDDQVLINKGEKFYWKGNGKILIICAPAWYPEQHKEMN